MITGANERDLQANDKFEVARSPLRKLVLFFHTDEEAVDFAEKYNVCSGLTDLDESEVEDVSAAEAHLDEMAAYVVIPNIKACHLQDTLKGIETISPLISLPDVSFYLDAANGDAVSLADIIDDLECPADVDVIPDVVSLLDEDIEAEETEVITPLF